MSGGPGLPNRNPKIWRKLSGSLRGQAGPQGLPGSSPPISDGDIVANISGGSAIPVGNAVSAVLDYVFGNSRGDLLFRGSTGWAVLGPGTSGNFLQTLGAGADPAWAATSGGTVTQIVAGAGLSGGTITSSGTIALDGTFTNHGVLLGTGTDINASAAGAAGSVLAGNTSADPTFQTITSLLDTLFSSTEGAVLYRGASAWLALAPGTLGQVLTSGGPSAIPAWGAPGPGGGGWTVYTTVLNDTTHTFSGLSGGSDLEIEIMGSSDQTTNQTVNVTVNAVVTGYSVQRMYATGSSAPAADYVSGQAAWNNFGQMVGTTASVIPPTSIWIKIFDYANTAFNKAGIFQTRQPSISTATEYVISGSMAVTGISATAITSVTITMAAGHFFTGTILKVRTV